MIFYNGLESLKVEEREDQRVVVLGENGRNRQEIVMSIPLGLDEIEPGMNRGLSIYQSDDGQLCVEREEDGVYLILSSQWNNHGKRGIGVFARTGQEHEIIAKSRGVDNHGVWDIFVIKAHIGDRFCIRYSAWDTKEIKQSSRSGGAVVALNPGFQSEIVGVFERRVRWSDLDWWVKNIGVIGLVCIGRTSDYGYTGRGCYGFVPRDILTMAKDLWEKLE